MYFNGLQGVLGVNFAWQIRGLWTLILIFFASSLGREVTRIGGGSAFRSHPLRAFTSPLPGGPQGRVEKSPRQGGLLFGES